MGTSVIASTIKIKLKIKINIVLWLQCEQAIGKWKAGCVRKWM